MESYLKWAEKIDRLSDWSGKIVSYLIYPLVGGVAYEVIARYFFRAPTEWAYDITYMLYGSIFMLGAAYTLLKKGPIRTDLFYNKWSPQKQGKIDAIMYLVLFFPGMIFYLVAGIDYAAQSWITHEKAANSPWMPCWFVRVLCSRKGSDYNAPFARRRTQVVREQAAKLRCGGSNPPGASKPTYGWAARYFVFYRNCCERINPSSGF